MASNGLRIGDDEIEDLNDGSKNKKKSKRKFNFDDFIGEHKTPLIFALAGVILTGFGVLIAKDSVSLSSNKIEVLESVSGTQEENREIIVEVAGYVEKPGVYKFLKGDRIDDILIAAGGVSVNADRDWMEKFLNRAAKLSDGQKIYIPSIDENLDNSQSDVLSANVYGGDQTVSESQGSGIAKMININTATQQELEGLWGIGPVYAQNIIEHRPYSKVDELIEKKILKTNVYDRNKDLLTVY